MKKEPKDKQTSKQTNNNNNKNKQIIKLTATTIIPTTKANLYTITSKLLSLAYLYIRYYLAIGHMIPTRKAFILCLLGIIIK